MLPVALLALACHAQPALPTPATDGIVAVLRGEAVPPAPARADVAAAIVAAAPLRHRVPRSAR